MPSLRLHCAICLVDSEKTWSVVPACGHVFHTACITTWFDTKSKAKEDRRCVLCNALASTVSHKPELAPGQAVARSARRTLAHKVLFFDEQLDSDQMTQRELPFRQPGVDDDEIEDDDDEPSRAARPPDRAHMQEVRDLRDRAKRAEAAAELLTGTAGERDALLLERDAVVIERDAALRDVEELKEEVKQLQLGQPNKLEEIELLNNSIASLDIELDDLKTELGLAKTEHAAAVASEKRKSARAREKHTQELKDVAVERDMLKRRVLDAGRKPAEQIKKLHLEVQELKTQLEENVREHDFNLAALERQKQDLVDEVTVARAESTASRKKVEDKDKEMDNIKRGNATYEHDLRKAKAKNLKLKEQIDSLSAERDHGWATKKRIVRDSASPEPAARYSFHAARNDSPSPERRFRVTSGSCRSIKRARDPSREPVPAPTPNSPESDLYDSPEPEDVPLAPARKKSRKSEDEDMIVISDSEDEDGADDALDVESPVAPPPIQPARPSQPFRDGKAKVLLTTLPSDKHMPVFGSQKRVGGGPKFKVKPRKA